MSRKNVLIVAATPMEINPLLVTIGVKPENTAVFFDCPFLSLQLSFLITGIGLVNTAYAMGQLADKPFSYCIQVGIAGSFDKDLALGECVVVSQDELSELGAQDDERFIKWEHMGLSGTSIYTAKGLDALSPCLKNLKQVRGISVNTVHGNETAIAKTKALFSPQIESMEGAAFFRACEHLKGNCWQLRAISNYVEKRDKSKWQMGLAIQHLNQLLVQVLHEINA